MTDPQTTAKRDTSWWTAPDRKVEYIGYAADSIDSPDETGQPIRFRPQVFVREFPSVKVKSEKTSTVPGRNGSPDLVTTSFTFDAESLGIPNFTNDFSASLRADDPAHAVLVWARSAGEPVYLAVETARKVKTDKGDLIDPHTPIHELRGATPDGKGGNANQTKATCKNVIAAVAQPGNPTTIMFTSEIVSDPAEWEGLRKNTDGRYAPAGFRPADGGIVSQPAPGAAAGPVAVDGDVVTDIAQQVAALLRPLIPLAAAKEQVRPAERPQVAQEEQPWKPWNTDGRLNAGSWAMSKYRSHWEWSVGKLAQVGIIDDVPELAEKLALRVLWMIDRVHAAVVPTIGSPWLTKSHAEASRWVLFTIDRLGTAGPDYAPLEFTAAVMTDEAVRKAWSEAVVDQATVLFHQGYANVAKHLDPTWVEPRADGQPIPARPQGQSTSAQSPASPPAVAAAAARPETPPAAAVQPAAPQPAAPQSAPQPAAPQTDPWEQPDPFGGVTASKVPDLTKRYSALLEAIGGHAVEMPGRFQPYLRDLFPGTDGTFHTIPAHLVARLLPSWEADPKGYELAAAEAYRMTLDARA